MTNDGGPAYPCKTFNQSGYPCGESMGMSLRDYFAEGALNLVAAKMLVDREYPEHGPDGIAREAYSIADAMLRAREEP